MRNTHNYTKNTHTRTPYHRNNNTPILTQTKTQIHTQKYKRVTKSHISTQSNTQITYLQIWNTHSHIATHTYTKHLNINTQSRTKNTQPYTKNISTTMQNHTHKNTCNNSHLSTAITQWPTINTHKYSKKAPKKHLYNTQSHTKIHTVTQTITHNTQTGVCDLCRGNFHEFISE